MGRRRRIPGELTNIGFFILVAPSEWIDIRDAAAMAAESMSEYARRALDDRFRREFRCPLGRQHQDRQ